MLCARLCSSVLVCVFVAVFVESIHAQVTCITGDDGFDTGTCCAPVSPNIPAPIQNLFPVYGAQDGEYNYIDGCVPASPLQVRVTVNVFPHPGSLPVLPLAGIPACDELALQVQVSDSATGTPLFLLGTNPTSPADRGNFVLAKYVRTWKADRLNSSGGFDEYRYWRYMIEGDAVAFDTNFLASAYVPGCYQVPAGPPPSGPYDAVVFRGFIDFNCLVPTGVESSQESLPDYSLVLSHYDGCLEHIFSPVNPRRLTAGLPSRHEGQSFHLVTPNNFNWASSPPSETLFDIDPATSFESLRSTVSHWQNIPGMAPQGPQCLGEMPIVARAFTDPPHCLCTPIPTSSIVYDQNFNYGDNWASCGTAHYWSSFFLVNEIPTGFTQAYIGQWASFAREYVRDVVVTNCIGTIEYADHCALSQTPKYYKSTGHVVWGNGTYFLSDDNRPRVGPDDIPMDSLLHFGDHASSVDSVIVGVPAYTNIIWTIAK